MPLAQTRVCRVPCPQEAAPKQRKNKPLVSKPNGRSSGCPELNSGPRAAPTVHEERAAKPRPACTGQAATCTHAEGPLGGNSNHHPRLWQELHTPYTGTTGRGGHRVTHSVPSQQVGSGYTWEECPQGNGVTVLKSRVCFHKQQICPGKRHQEPLRVLRQLSPPSPPAQN